MNYLLLFSMAEFGNNIVKTLSSSLGIWHAVIFNVLGIIAICLKVTELQLKTRNNIILFSIGAAFCWMIYFLLNGNVASSLTSLIGVVQALIFYQRGKHEWAKSSFWLYLFLGVQIAICIFTFKDWTTFLAVSAGLFGTLAYFVMQEKYYRYLILCSLICWLLNSTFNFYLIAFLADALSTTSIIISITRYTIKEKKEGQSKAELVDTTD